MEYNKKVEKPVFNLVKNIIFRAAELDLPVLEKDITLEHPTAEEHGDLASNLALVLAKKFNKNPQEIARTFVEKLQKDPSLKDIISKIEIAGPGFINFWFDKKFLLGELKTIIKNGKQYGQSSLGNGKTVVIDYSSPNIAKPFGIGHLRSTIIGQALYNLYESLGYKVIGDNHLGDWGTQFGKLLYMITQEKLTDFSIDKLEKLYVEFHRRAETNLELEQKARGWFKKLEEGDERAKSLWQKCVEISLTEFNRIYELLDVKIDYAYGESFYENIMPEVIVEAKTKGIAKESNGAWIIEIPEIKTPLMLVKSDGTTTYATRDLATLKFRKEKWDPDLVIYEVGAEQSLHFSQVFAVARMLEYVRSETKLVHTKHGLYRFARGKMSTRKGQTVKLEKVLLEAISRAEKLGSKATAKPVGIGAIKYFDLKHGVQGDIIFDWEKMFSLEGDSGPYLQYTYARGKSVLKKAGEKNILSETFYYSPAENLIPEELIILRYMYRFPEVVELAAKNLSPNLICSYLFELAKRFNNFYSNVPIILYKEKELSESEIVTQNLRLALTEATATIIQNGLNLLGIETPERM